MQEERFRVSQDDIWAELMGHNLDRSYYEVLKGASGRFFKSEDIKRAAEYFAAKLRLPAPKLIAEIDNGYASLEFQTCNEDGVEVNYCSAIEFYQKANGDAYDTSTDELFIQKKNKVVKMSKNPGEDNMNISMFEADLGDEDSQIHFDFKSQEASLEDAIRDAEQFLMGYH